MCGLTLILPGVIDPGALIPRGTPPFSHWYAARCSRRAAPQAVSPKDLLKHFTAQLTRRGPDAQNSITIAEGLLAATVLALRGSGVCAQPLVCEVTRQSPAFER